MQSMDKLGGRRPLGRQTQGPEDWVQETGSLPLHTAWPCRALGHPTWGQLGTLSWDLFPEESFQGPFPS